MIYSVHVDFFKFILGLFLRPVLRVNEIFPSNNSALSITLKGLCHKVYTLLHLATTIQGGKAIKPEENVYLFLKQLEFLFASS